MKKRVAILGVIFTVIVGVTFSIGIVNNPTFNIYDFCAGLSSEFIGWILAVTIFQYYYDEKMKARKAHTITENPLSAADEIRKLKSLLDDGAITQEEFDSYKKKLLAK